MRYKRLVTASICGLLSFWACAANASVVVVVDNVGPSEVIGGSPAVLSVSLYNNGEVGSLDLTGYTLGFDFFQGANGVGVGLVGGFSAPDFSVAFNPVFASTASMQISPARATNYDFIFSTAANTVQDISGSTSISPFHLFDLTIQTSSSTPLGIYDFRFVQPALRSNTPFPGTTNINVLNGIGSVTLESEGGQFEITAVPEPGSMLALTGLLAGGGLHQWRKRKRGARLAVTT